MTKDKILHELETTKNLVRWEITGLKLRDTDFAGANLEYAVLRGCRLTDCSFADANLHDVLFERCDVGHAVFERANLRGTRLVHCSGLTPQEIALLEKRGAVVEQPAGRLSASVVVVLVLFGAVALFLLAGGHELFRKPATEEQPATSSTPAPTADSLERANAAFATGEFAAAAELFSQAEAAGDVATEHLINHVIACRQAECSADVPKLVEKVLNKSEQDAEKLHARILLAGSMLRAGAATEGLALYDQLLEERAGQLSDQRAILMDKGTMLWQAKDNTAALNAFQQLLKISDPDQKAGVWLNMALVHRAAGNAKAEAAALRKAEQDTAAPKAVLLDAKLGLAMIDIRRGRLDQARTQILALLGENADHGQVLTAVRQIAETLQKQGKVNDIETLYRELLAAFASSPAALNDARVDLANMLTDAGRNDEALTLYQSVAAESPNPVQKSWASETVVEIQRQRASEESAAAASATPPAQ